MSVRHWAHTPVSYKIFSTSASLSSLYHPLSLTPSSYSSTTCQALRLVVLIILHLHCFFSILVKYAILGTRKYWFCFQFRYWYFIWKIIILVLTEEEKRQDNLRVWDNFTSLIQTICVLKLLIFKVAFKNLKPLF